MPAEYRAEAVVQRDARQPATSRGLKVLLPRADIGREVIADELRKQGAEVTEVIAYRTVVAEPSARASPTSTACCSSGASTSSRSPARRRCATSCSVLGAEPAADLLRTTVVASIGPVTAEAAAQFGITDDDHAGAATRFRRWSTRSSKHFEVDAQAQSDEPREIAMTTRTRHRR